MVMASIPLLCASMNERALIRNNLGKSIPNSGKLINKVTYNFTTMGTSTWVGLGTPTFRCTGDQISSGVCTGQSFVADGVFAATRPSPFYPNGFSGADKVTQPFDGSTNDLVGVDPHPQNAVTVCMTYEPYVTGTTQSILSNSEFSSPLAYALDIFQSVNSVIIQVGTTDNTNIQRTLGTITNLGNQTFCVSYCYVTNGTSIIRSNYNGVVSAETTNAVGPIHQTSHSPPLTLNIGTRFTSGAFNAYMTGGISDLAFWNERCSSAAELASAVDSMMSIAPTFTQTRVGFPENLTSIASVGDMSRLGDNLMGINENGMQLFGGNTNKALRSEEFDNAAVWVPENGGGAAATVVTGGAALDPFHRPTVADQLAIPAVSGAGAYSGVCQSITASAAKHYFSTYFQHASATANPYIYMYNGATYYSMQTAVTTAWTRFHKGSTANLTAVAWKFCIGTDLRDGAQSTTLANTVLVFGAQVEVVQTGLYRPTTSGAGANAVNLVMTSTAPGIGVSANTSFDISANVCWPGTPSTSFATVISTVVQLTSTTPTDRMLISYTNGNWTCDARGTADGAAQIVATLADSWAEDACRTVKMAWNASTKKSTCYVYNGSTLVGSETTPATTNKMTDITRMYLGTNGVTVGRDLNGAMSTVSQCWPTNSPSDCP